MVKKMILPAGEKEETKVSDVINLPVEAIRPLSIPPGEPVKQIRTLMRTVEKNGFIAPVCVYRTADGRYELLAGRHRLTLAIKAGIREIPAVVCSPEDENEAVFNIIQRTEGIFNCFEEADYLKRMVDSGKYTQRDLAEKIGKSQAYVSNKMRLGRLSNTLRRKIIEGGLSERHALLLLRINDEKSRKNMADRAVREKLSVEKTEELVRELVKKEGMKTEKCYNRAADKYRNKMNLITEEKEQNEDPAVENAARLKLLIKAVSNIVEITRQNGLIVFAGQRNTEKNVELIIAVPRAENNVSLRKNSKTKSKRTEPEEEDKVA